MEERPLAHGAIALGSSIADYRRFAGWAIAEESWTGIVLSRQKLMDHLERPTRNTFQI